MLDPYSETHECDFSRTKCDASGAFVCLNDDDPRCPDHAQSQRSMCGSCGRHCGGSLASVEDCGRISGRYCCADCTAIPRPGVICTDDHCDCTGPNGHAKAAMPSRKKIRKSPRLRALVEAERGEEMTARPTRADDAQKPVDLDAIIDRVSRFIVRESASAKRDKIVAMLIEACDALDDARAALRALPVPMLTEEHE